MAVIIKDIRAVCTAPQGIPLVIVRVDTNQPGLYGLGCATFTQRFKTVAHAVEEYMKPLLVGKDASRIEDIWQMAMVSAYWRNGPVLNNAISGVDMALWDIKGKQAGMPCYDLFGGKCRDGVAVYMHADGNTPGEVEDRIRAYMEKGLKYVRAQMGGYGGRRAVNHRPDGACEGALYDPDVYRRSIPVLFDHLRDKLGFGVELLHDVHERLTPIDAVGLAKRLEEYGLFFLEDILPPEGVEWFENVRGQCATPLAMGELFNNPREWTPLISGKLIDFIRVHVSQIGGITPALKLAHLCEAYGVRTAWHGPGDTSPVGHAANVHMDYAVWNFGIQEWAGLDERCLEVFPGSPELRGGYLYLNGKPGLGIDLDEKAAAKYPCSGDLPKWTNARIPDGTLARP